MTICSDWASLELSTPTRWKEEKEYNLIIIKGTDSVTWISWLAGKTSRDTASLVLRVHEHKPIVDGSYILVCQYTTYIAQCPSASLVKPN